MALKMAPEACAEDGRQLKRAKRSLGRLRGGKTKRKPYLKVVGGDSCFSQRGSGKGSVRGQ